jgi:hypothetical protein
MSPYLEYMWREHFVVNVLIPDRLQDVAATEYIFKLGCTTSTLSRDRWRKDRPDISGNVLFK